MLSAFSDYTRFLQELAGRASTDIAGALMNEYMVRRRSAAASRLKGPGMLMRVERARWKDPINSIDWINVTDGELSVNLQRGLKYITAGFVKRIR